MQYLSKFGSGYILYNEGETMGLVPKDWAGVLYFFNIAFGVFLSLIFSGTFLMGLICTLVGVDF